MSFKNHLTKYGPKSKMGSKARESKEEKRNPSDCKKNTSNSSGESADPDPKQALAHHQCAVFRTLPARKYIGFGKTHFHEIQRVGSSYYDESFPKAVSLGARARGYLKSELDAWLASKAAMRTGGAK